MYTVTVRNKQTGQVVTCKASGIIHTLTCWWQTHTPADPSLIDAAAALQRAVAQNLPTDKFERLLGIEIAACQPSVNTAT